MKFIKQITTAVLFFILGTAQSQSLDNYISNESIAVVEVSGDQIFSLISNSDLVDLMPPSQNGEPLDISSFGFDVSDKAYYFTQINDSILYHNFIVRLNDAQLAAETLSGVLPPPLTKVEGYDFSVAEGMCAAWNSDRVIFSFFDVPKVEYTMDDLLEEKRNSKEENTGDEIEEDESNFELQGDGSIEELENELLMKNLFAPSLYSPEEINDMLGVQITSILNSNANTSVNRLSSYTEGKVNNSSAYFWVNDIDKIVKENVDPSDFSEIAYLTSVPDVVLGLKEVTGNLIFDKDEIKMSTQFTVNENLVGYYEKMYNSKMDKSFLKYFNQDDVMSYMSFSTDVTEVLKGYPDMMKTLYGGWVSDYQEEVDLAIDVVEVFLDEEAIGELMTGDGLIMLHDIEEEEVTYKTFEYDVDYNAVEVEKTKMEQIPMFSILIGSENERIINRIMRVARKHEWASYESGYHVLPASSMGAPFDVYFVYNDGIAFLTNSTSRLNTYKTGKKVCNLGDHKKVLKNNMFNFYLNTESAIKKLNNFYPMDEQMTKYVADNYKEMYMMMTKMKEDKIGFDMVFKTNEEKGNALKLILATVKDLSRGPQ